MNLLTKLPITPEDWDKKPPSVQILVVTLWEENRILKEQVKRLQTQEQLINQALKEPVEIAQKYVKEQNAVILGETSCH